MDRRRRARRPRGRSKANIGRWVQNDLPRAATSAAPCGGFAGSYLKQPPLRGERGGVRIVTTRHGGWCLRGVAQPSARVCDPDLARSPNSHQCKRAQQSSPKKIAQNLLTSESHTRHLSLRPRRAFARRVPSAMLSLSRVARASATGRAAAASVSATRSYHKNVRVTRPPRLGTFSHLLRARARALQ